MTGNVVSSSWKKILPIIGKSTGGAAIALVTIATIDSVLAQGGIQGLTPALLSTLSNLFGDVAAGPLVDRLLSGGNEGRQLDDFLNEFEKQLQENDVRRDIAELLSNQETFTNVLGVALEYHENSAVERILRGVASYQDFHAERIIQTFSEGYSESLKVLDPEIQYLVDFVANLQNLGGVWRKYINLPVEAEDEPSYQQSTIAASWKLPRVFTLLEQSSIEAEFSIKQRTRARFSNIQEVIKKHPRFVLVGDPGSGKTTTIQHLALEVALKRLSNPSANPLPLLLYLPSWGENQTIEDFIHRHWRLIPDPIELLARGEMHLFLDGLNEMGASGPTKAKKLRRWLRNDRSPENMIVTCRKADYINDLDIDLPFVLIEEMDEQLVQEFVAQYLGTSESIFLTKVLPDQTGNNESGHLFALARNPFMLVSLMVIYSSSTTGDLPRNNGELFQQLVKVLWERELIRNTTGWTPFDNMRANLSRLAFTMINEEKPSDVPISYVLNHVEDPRLLEAARSANLLVINNSEMRFYHQLIQEYFAAEQIKIIGLPHVFKEPSFDHRGRIGQKWDQVIIALSGITANKDAFLDELISKDPFLAAMCVESGVKLSLWAQDKLEETLISELSHSNVNKRLAAAKALEQINWQPQDFQTEVLYRIASCDWIGCVELGADAIPFLITTTKDADEGVRQGALWAIEIIEDALDAVELWTLKDMWIVGETYEFRDIDDLVRWVAKQKEGVWAKGFSRAIPSYRENELIEEDLELDNGVEKLINDLYHADKNVRLRSILYLGKLSKTEAVSHLLRILNVETSDNIILATIWALGEIGVIEAVPDLTERLAHENCNIRWFSANSLGKIRDTSAIPGLIKCLEDNEKPLQADRRVSEVAAEALEKIGTPEAIIAVENWRRSRI